MTGAEVTRHPVVPWLWCGAVVCVGLAGIGVSGWPLFFVVCLAFVGVFVARRPWLVVGTVAATLVLFAVPDRVVAVVGVVWMWLTALLGAAAIVAAVRRWRPGAPVVLWHLGLLLPRTERDSWRAEMRAVLHACEGGAETRRQVLGYLTALPATVVTSRRVRR